MEDGNSRNSISEDSGETLETNLPSPGVDSSNEMNRCSIDFDPAEFLHFLAHTDWPDEQKLEYATLVWGIVCQFVAMGHNVHPLQLAQKSSGQASGKDVAQSNKPSKMLGSSHGKLIEEFMRLGAADQHEGKKESHL